MAMMTKRPFGRMPDGTPVEEFTLRDGDCSCEILTYGGALRSLVVPDRDGKPVDILLGFDTLEDYRAQDKFMGAGTATGSAAAALSWKERSTFCGPTTAPTTSTAARRGSTNRSGR